MKTKKMSPVVLLSLGYFISILVGTLLLLLPVSSKEGPTNIVDSLFVATSSVCVTGLVPFNTFEHWSLFGQIVIICLIQIGGLGFMTIITLILMFFKKNIGLYNRTILMQSAGSYNISLINVLIKRIIIGTFLFEFLGAICLFLRFNTMMETKDAIFYGIFHSISAFCNAGFDLFNSTNGSLTGFYNDPIVLGIIMCLIVIGGLGFIVWSDLIDSSFKFKKLQLHSKIVLVFNFILIIVPAFLFFIFEFTNIGNNGHLLSFNFGEKVLNSLFLSISPRTAGFNAIDLESMTSSGKLLTIILMFIGGNSGSTAGGLKVTTLIVVIANLISSAREKENVVLFKRTISTSIIKQASSLFLAYIIFVLISTLFICAIENFPLESILFEVTSAIGTVGLSLGLSSNATILTKFILIFLMYAGRIGALTFFDAVMRNRNDRNLIEPKGKILVG